MTDREPEDLSGAWLPDPPIRCATLAPEAGAEPSGATCRPQTGTQHLHRLRERLATEQAKLDAADRHPRPDLDHLRVTPHNGMSAGLAIALAYIDQHIRQAETAANDSLHARLAAALHDCSARHPDDIATAPLPVIERETAQLQRERDMALNAASQARARLARVRAVAPDLELEATLPGMHDAAREAKRDASRRIRNIIDQPAEGTPDQPCVHCGHPGDWHDPWEGCVGPGDIGDPGTGDCTCTHGPTRRRR